VAIEVSVYPNQDISFYRTSSAAQFRNSVSLVAAYTPRSGLHVWDKAKVNWVEHPLPEDVDATSPEFIRYVTAILELENVQP